MYWLLTFYSYMVEMFKKIFGYLAGIYSQLEMQVLDGTFTQVYWYNYETNKKHTVRDNTGLWKVIYLIWIKRILKRHTESTKSYTSLETVPWPKCLNDTRMMPSKGLFEFVFFASNTKLRYYTKNPLALSHDEIVTRLQRPVHKHYLFATMSDKLNVTDIINTHLSSFSYDNIILPNDIYTVFMLEKNNYMHHVGCLDVNLFLRLVDGDTLEETVFLATQPIITDTDFRH